MKATASHARYSATHLATGILAGIIPSLLIVYFNREIVQWHGPWVSLFSLVLYPSGVLWWFWYFSQQNQDDSTKRTIRYTRTGLLIVFLPAAIFLPLFLFMNPHSGKTFVSLYIVFSLPSVISFALFYLASLITANRPSRLSYLFLIAAVTLFSFVYLIAFSDSVYRM